MEENASLFSLSLDPVTRTHLTETAKWARFLAMVGFVFLALLLGMGIYTSMLLNQFENSYTGYRRDTFATGLGMGTAVTYLIAVVIAFFPLVFMLRFANNMKKALYTNDQTLLNTSFQNLKVYFRYLGIISIIGLVLMGLSLFIAIAGSAL